MSLLLPDRPLSGQVVLPISKSIANRYLIIAALASDKRMLDLFHQPDSGSEGQTLQWFQGGGAQTVPEDVQVLYRALMSNDTHLDIGMAGTAMRFLTAYFAVQDGKTVRLTGDERMQQRPIAELVTVLSELGADIQYLKGTGYPPLSITGKELNGGEVEIPGSVSSQFISALMMVGPVMRQGLRIRLREKVLSRPYIELTADCMRKSGVVVHVDEHTITVPSSAYHLPPLSIESDWSAASYFYAFVAVRPRSRLLLNGLHINSSQGDSILVDWFRSMGVTTVQKESGVEITSSDRVQLPAELDFTHHPDLAQTFAFLAATLGQPLRLTGLDNLRLKETDRVAALRNELEKLGVSVSVVGHTLTVSGVVSVKQAVVNTYNDHRMAMSAAVLSTIVPTHIQDADVVRKSFPGFWAQVNRLMA